MMGRAEGDKGDEGGVVCWMVGWKGKGLVEMG